MIGSAAPAPSASQEVRVLRGPGALAEAEHVYRYLWSRTDPAPPTLDFDRVFPWWQMHCQEGSLFLVVLQLAGKPVAMAPLYIRQREPTSHGVLRTVCFMGTGEAAEDEAYGTNNGWLGAAHHHGAMNSAVVAALLDHRRDWDRLWLANVAPESTLAEVLHDELRDLLVESELRQTSNWVIDMADSFEAYLAVLPSSKRRNALRRVLRRADDVGIETRWATTEAEACRMFDDLCRLHTAHWQSRGKPGACASPVFVEFQRRVLAVYARQQRLRMLEFRLDGAVVGVDYAILAGRRVYTYLGGIDMQHSNLALGILAMLRHAQRAAEEGIEMVDMLAGDYGYKHRLATRELPLTTLEGVNDTPMGRAWSGLRRLKRRMSGPAAGTPEADGDPAGAGYDDN